MKKPSEDFVDLIYQLYGDEYNDEVEDFSLGGLDWFPEQKAQYKNLAAFQRELDEQGIKLSTGKILITGGCCLQKLAEKSGRCMKILLLPYQMVEKV